MLAVLAAVFFGFVAGNVIFLHMFRWLVGPVHVLRECPRTEFARYSVMLSLSILHPAPWLVVVIPYVTYRIVVGSVEPYWFWFLGSFYLSFLYLLGMGLFFWHRIRRASKERAL